MVLYLTGPGGCDPGHRPLDNLAAEISYGGELSWADGDVSVTVDGQSANWSITVVWRRISRGFIRSTFRLPRD